MIFLLWACAAPVEEAPAATAIVPAEGRWAIRWEQTYGGTCQLADMSTSQPEETEWVIELESVGFTIYDETGYPFGCDLADDTFTCSLGTYDVPYDQSGLDATEYITTVTTGTFADAEAFAAIYAITAECVGADCPAVGTQYGDAFAYPCTAEAGYTGEWRGE